MCGFLERYVKHLANVDRAALTVTRETICLLADQAGLTAEPVLRRDDGLFIGFRLKWCGENGVKS